MTRRAVSEPEVGASASRTATLRAAAVRGARSAARRAGVGRLRHAVLRRYYRRRLKAPVDPNLAVYASYWFRGYSCNPRAIYEAARRLVPEVRGVWVVQRDRVASIPQGVDYVVANSREFYDVMARAAVRINNVNFPNEMEKRPGTIEVQTHHGTPLKQMGLDLQGKSLNHTIDDVDALLQRVARWDYSISSNEYSTEIWERVYPGQYESLEVGYPRNDVLVTATERDAAAVRRRLGIEPGKRVVLYAPTFRDSDTDYEPLVDLPSLAQRLGEDWVILARAHYFHESGGALSHLHAAGRLVDVSSHPVVEELQLAADVLVTDYSSVMFDYAILDRPIVIFAPDWEAYRDSRGVYFDLLATPPGPVTRTGQELAEALMAAAWQPDSTALRSEFRDRFCRLERGDAAERVVRRVWRDRIR
jgi:CDP-glycerol glycerophosphotransferase